MKIHKMLWRIITGKTTVKEYLIYFAMYYIFWLFGAEDEW